MRTKCREKERFICVIQKKVLPLQPQISLAMNDSSFIISPVSADFSDVWSEPELLSAEGYNALYVATRFGRKYVLKALAEPYRESTPHIEMLRKEFAIGVAVDHPNIVRLLDFGHMDSIGWYIQMEYIDGITLERFLETQPAASVRRRILSQLLDALAFLHERQIIHRDIKPSNILITRNGSTVKLIDFGVSDTDDYVTFKQPAGSMAYIAPEQLAGKTIDNRADIYAVGKIIALLFPHRYQSIVRRCTQIEPARRYASCPAVARAIKRADTIRTKLPLSVLLIAILLAATWSVYWGVYNDYRQSEQRHSEQEQFLSANIDSLRRQNEMRQYVVDSLNRVVDSLVEKSNRPTPEEQMREKAIRVHQRRYTAMREAVKKGEIRTQWELEMRNSESADEEFDKALLSIKDPYLKEKFRDAYFAIYLHTRSPLYDSLYQALPPE